MDWKTLLAYITGSVDQALLLRNEYLVTENRILRNQITGHVQLTDGERKTLATIGQQLGKQALQEVATTSSSRTPFSVGIVGWSPRSLTALSPPYTFFLLNGDMELHRNRQLFV
jgi:hypothetical protein